MVFLAHVYLSGENDPIKIGNFMADGICGTTLMLREGCNFVNVFGRFYLQYIIPKVGDFLSHPRLRETFYGW